MAAFGGFVTTAGTVARLSPGPPVVQLWAAAAARVKARAVVAGVRAVLAAQPAATSRARWSSRRR